MARLKKYRVGTFPGKLMTMLESAEIEKYDHIVAWTANGSGFRVKDKDLFVQKVCSAYYKLKRFRSFERQLNFWGFIRDGKYTTTWNHPIFRRGDPKSLMQMEYNDKKGKREKCGRASINKIACRDVGVVLSCEEPQKVLSNEPSSEEEEGDTETETESDSSTDTEIESASSPDAELEPEEQSSPLPTRPPEVNESYITEEDCPMDLDSSIVPQLHQYLGVTFTEAFPSKEPIIMDPTTTEPMRGNHEEPLCEGMTGAEWDLGDDSMVISDFGMVQGV